jgi:hypothetical protein
MTLPDQKGDACHFRHNAARLTLAGSSRFWCAEVRGFLLYCAREEVDAITELPIGTALEYAHVVSRLSHAT